MYPNYLKFSHVFQQVDVKKCTKVLLYGAANMVAKNKNNKKNTRQRSGPPLVSETFLCTYAYYNYDIQSSELFEIIILVYNCTYS